MAQTLTNLKTYMRRQISGQTGSQAEEIMRIAANNALDQLSSEQRWDWYLVSPAYLRLRAPYSTGTLAVTQDSATVTLTGGTFPSWVSSTAQLSIGGQFRSIASRDSGTQITLGTAWGNDTDSSVETWAVFQDEYQLPTTLRIFGGVTPGPTWPWGGTPRAYEELIRCKNAYLSGQKYPSVYAIRKNFLCLWPYPNANCDITYWYYKKPAELTADGDTADWDTDLNLEVLHRALDYQLCQAYGRIVSGDANQALARYREALGRAKGSERTVPPNETNFGASRFGVRMRYGGIA